MAKIKGNNQNNVLIGTTGNDVILGFGGNDILKGGNGRDRLPGRLDDRDGIELHFGTSVKLLESGRNAQ